MKEHGIPGGMRGLTFLMSILTLGGSVVAPGTLVAQAREDRGRAIAEEADRRARGYGDMEARLTMVLRNRHGQEKTRRLTLRVLEGEGGDDKTLLVIDQPRDLQGTALLTHSESAGSDDQWLYLPALKRVKRIASSSQTGSFMGSEFSYEDIGSQKLDEYTYRFEGEDAVEDMACRVIERVPVDPDSGYGRQLVWIDRAEYRILRIDYFDREGEPLKTLLLNGFRRYEGRFWRPAEMEMANHQTGKSTTILWHEYRFGTGLTAVDFERNRLHRAG